MGVIFGVAVVFGGEEILLDGGDAGSGGCEEGREVGCHCGVVPLVGGEGFALGNASIGKSSAGCSLELRCELKVSKQQVSVLQAEWTLSRFMQFVVVETCFAKGFQERPTPRLIYTKTEESQQILDTTELHMNL